MPEGDLLRRTAALLDRALAGHVLVRAELRWPGVGGLDLTGRTVLGTVAYGKHLLTRLDDGTTVHTHLRMDGSWRVWPTGSSRAAGRSPDVRAVLGAEHATAVGYLLGMLDVLRTRDEQAVVGHLGPDILADTVDAPELLRRWSAAGGRPAAEVLLDQRVVAGIGTIFMAESLFADRVWPWTPADEVADPGHLLAVARRLMQRSVAAGRPDERVHGRAGRPCTRCGGPVAVGTAGEPPVQRVVFWCPRCQAQPRATG